MREGNEGVVAHRGAGSAAVDLGIYALGGAEEEERLVDQVRAQVVEHAARLLGRIQLAPGARANLRSPALEAGLEPVHLAERALLDQLADREEVAVPAAVVEDGQHQRALAGRLFDPAAVGGGGGE